MKLDVPTHDRSGYRNGCRCAECRTDKSAADLARRREALYGEGGELGPAVRRRFLTALREHRNVMTAASEVGLTYQRIYGATRALPEFAEQINALTG